MSATIPNYRLLEKIGEGGFGEVWLAETVTGKRRAVKVVRRATFRRPELADGEIDVLFEQEFQGVRRFEDLAAGHPSLIDVQHVGRDPDGEFYYYAMPLADNAADPASGCYEPLNLERRISRDGPMGWNDALALLRVLAGGLERLHRAGLCHGDVSSANVLFVSGQPVLADPGLTSDVGAARLTRSPGFSDPSPTAATNPQGDVFGLGRLLYHLVIGLHPADSFPLTPADRLRVLPAVELATLLDNCCDPDPGKRFEHAGPLLASLEPATESAPADRPGGSSVPKSVGVGLVVSGVCLSGILLWSWLGSRHQDLSTKVNGERVLLLSKAGEDVLWERKFGHLVESAALGDLDGDSIPEVVCAMRDTGSSRPGRLTALGLDGEIRWQFDLVSELQDGGDFGQGPMKLEAVKITELDDVPGKELVVIGRNPGNLYSSSLQIVGGSGELLASYWNPGRIEARHVEIVRRSPEEPAFLAFCGRNELIDPLISEDQLPKEGFELVIGLIDPRIRGQAHLPLNGTGRRPEQGLLRWCYRINPPLTRAGTLSGCDYDHDGTTDLVLNIQADSKEPPSWPETTLGFDLDGHLISDLSPEIQVVPLGVGHGGASALTDVDFARLTRDRLLADSRRDFSTTQNGANHWEYGSVPSEGPYDYESFRTIRYYDDQNKTGVPCWNDHSGSFLAIARTEMHPADDRRAVRRWISPFSGRIAVVADAIRVNGIEWGTVGLEIHHRETCLHRATMGKTRFQAVMEVGEGDHVDFVLDSHGKTWADQTILWVGIWKYD